jgi:hypothetical protein
LPFRHDPEKWKPVFRKDHASLKTRSAIALRWPPQWATKAMNRATADNQSAQSEEEGLEPTKEWVKDLIDEIMAEEFASPDLELHWLDEDDGDPETVLEGRLKVGALTLNEMRDALGLDPFDNAAADRPMVLTATGYVPIEANAGQQEAGANGRSANAQSAPVVQKYSSDQPRVSAGNSKGGQWTSDGNVALNSDALVLSDAPDSTWMPGAQSAQNRPRGGGSGPILINGQWFEPTPGQAARLTVAEARLQTAISQVRRIDQNWTPTPGFDETIEGRISTLEAQAQEAEQLLTRLNELGFPRNPDTGRRIMSPPDTKTGDPEIDRTTEKLMNVLGEVTNNIGPRPDLSPSQYGTLVHTEFAEMLRAKGLPGIDTNDVERTFSLTDELFYGAKYSIRPDAIYRTDDQIRAIYDVKTGRGMREVSVIKIRYMTGSGRTIPVIELNRSRGAILKFR